MPFRILIADDQQEQLAAVVALLKGLDVTIEIATDGGQALQCLLNGPFDLSLLDMHMPRLTGLEVLGQLQQAGQLVPSILMTGNPSREIEMAAMDLGVITMLHKPIPAEVLRITVQQFFSLPPDHPRPSMGPGESPTKDEPW